MTFLANIVFDPALFAGWLFAGLASGWVAGKMMGEPTYGPLGDLILGGVGGLAGGLIFGIFGDGAGFWGTIVLAIVGAWACILAGRMVVAWRG